MAFDRRPELIAEKMADYARSTHIDPKEFDQIIQAHRNKFFYPQISIAMQLVFQLEQENKKWKMGPFDQDSFHGFHLKGQLLEAGLQEIIISSSIKALELIFDLKRDSLKSIINVFSQKIRHIIAHEFKYMSPEEKAKINEQVEEYNAENLSELLVIAVSNHELVRYLLEKEPEYAEVVKSHLNKSDLESLINQFPPIFSPPEKGFDLRG